jgi:hypothetical protein
MIDWEDSLKKGCELPPYTLWGTYHPGHNPIPKPEPWSEEEIKERIGVGKLDLRGKTLDILDRVPGRDRIIMSYMRMKRRRGRY